MDCFDLSAIVPFHVIANERPVWLKSSIFFPGLKLLHPRLPRVV